MSDLGAERDDWQGAVQGASVDEAPRRLHVVPEEIYDLRSEETLDPWHEPGIDTTSSLYKTRPSASNRAFCNQGLAQWLQDLPDVREIRPQPRPEPPSEPPQSSNRPRAQSTSVSGLSGAPAPGLANDLSMPTPTLQHANPLAHHPLQLQGHPELQVPSQLEGVYSQPQIPQRRSSLYFSTQPASHALRSQHPPNHLGNLRHNNPLGSMLYDLKEHLPIGGYQEDDHVQSAIFADDEEEEEEKATKSLFGSVRHHRSKAGTPAAGLNDGRKSSAPVILKEMSKSSKKFFDKLTAKKEPEYYHLSVAIIGDRHCGKGTLLSHYTLDSHIDGTVHQPDVNTFSIQLTGLLTVDNFTTRMEIVDIVHQNVHAGNVHPLSLKKYDVVIICVDIGNQRNLESVTKWRMEIERHCPAVPRVLLGLKADLRPNFPTLRLGFLKESIASTVEQGEKAARENNAAAYYECSAQTGEGVTAFFESLARFSVQTIRNHNN